MLLLPDPCGEVEDLCEAIGGVGDAAPEAGAEGDDAILQEAVVALSTYMTLRSHLLHASLSNGSQKSSWNDVHFQRLMRV